MRRFQQVDVFSPEPLRGNPVAVVVDGEGLATEQMQALHALDEPLRGDLPAAARATRPPTTGCASSRPRASCPSPATRRWAAATPGCAPAGGHATTSASSRNAAPAWCRYAALDGQLAFQAPPLRRSGPVEEADLASDRRASCASSATTSWTASGWTTGPAGWPSCWPRRRTCWPSRRRCPPMRPRGESTSGWWGPIRPVPRAPTRCEPSSATTVAGSWRTP